MYDIYQGYKAEGTSRMKHHVFTVMTYNTIGVAGGLEPSPFLLEEMTAPHVPHGIAKGLPVDIGFITNIERSDSMRFKVGQNEMKSTRHALANQNVAVVFSLPPRLTFACDLTSEGIKPAELRGYKDVIR